MHSIKLCAALRDSVIRPASSRASTNQNWKSPSYSFGHSVSLSRQSQWAPYNRYLLILVFLEVFPLNDLPISCTVHQDLIWIISYDSPGKYFSLTIGFLTTTFFMIPFVYFRITLDISCCWSKAGKKVRGWANSYKVEHLWLFPLKDQCALFQSCLPLSGSGVRGHTGHPLPLPLLTLACVLTCTLAWP